MVLGGQIRRRIEPKRLGEAGGQDPALLGGLLQSESIALGLDPHAQLVTLERDARLHGTMELGLVVSGDGQRIGGDDYHRLAHEQVEIRLSRAHERLLTLRVEALFRRQPRLARGEGPVDGIAHVDLQVDRRAHGVGVLVGLHDVSDHVLDEAAVAAIGRPGRQPREELDGGAGDVRLGCLEPLAGDLDVQAVRAGQTEGGREIDRVRGAGRWRGLGRRLRGGTAGSKGHQLDREKERQRLTGGSHRDSTTVTGWPSAGGFEPASTTVWSGARPSRISTLVASWNPALTATRLALPSETVNTKSWPFPATRAAAGISSTSAFRSIAILARAYIPGRSSLLGLGISTSAVMVFDASSSA